MLSNDLAMEINEDLGIGTHHPLILFACIELTAVDTTAEQSGALVLAVITSSERYASG
jgi:hypothetical protein